MNGLDLSCFNSTGSVQLWVLQLFVQFVQSFVIIRFVLLILHFETQHQILAHFWVVLRSLNVLHQTGDLLVGLFNVCFQRFKVVLVHDFLLSQSVDLFLEFVNITHRFIVSLVILNKTKKLQCRFVSANFSFWWTWPWPHHLSFTF